MRIERMNKIMSSCWDVDHQTINNLPKKYLDLYKKVKEVKELQNKGTSDSECNRRLRSIVKNKVSKKQCKKLAAAIKNQVEISLAFKKLEKPVMLQLAVVSHVGGATVEGQEESETLENTMKRVKRELDSQLKKPREVDKRNWKKAKKKSTFAMVMSLLVLLTAFAPGLAILGMLMAGVVISIPFFIVTGALIAVALPIFGVLQRLSGKHIKDYEKKRSPALTRAEKYSEALDKALYSKGKPTGFKLFASINKELLRHKQFYKLFESHKKTRDLERWIEEGIRRVPEGYSKKEALRHQKIQKRRLEKYKQELKVEKGKLDRLKKQIESDLEDSQKK